MIRTFSTNNKNDLYLGPDRNLVMSTAIEGVKNACANAAKTQLGEMLLFSKEGIPNFTAVWGGNPNILQFEFSLRKTLLSVTDVVEITSLSITINNGILNYEAVILTTYGSLTLNGVTNASI